MVQPLLGGAAKPADSKFGHLGRLCAADAAGLRFVVPLRANTGWMGWFATDVAGGIALRPAGVQRLRDAGEPRRPGSC